MWEHKKECSSPGARKVLITGPVKNFHVPYQTKGHDTNAKISTHCTRRCLFNTIPWLHEARKRNAERLKRTAERLRSTATVISLMSLQEYTFVLASSLGSKAKFYVLKQPVGQKGLQSASKYSYSNLANLAGLQAQCWGGTASRRCWGRWSVVRDVFRCSVSKQNMFICTQIKNRRQELINYK